MQNEVILALSYMALAGVAWANKYSYMLVLNIIACALCGLYLYMSSAYTGAVVSSIAAAANLVQLLLPVKKTDRRLMTRNILAMLIASIVSIFLYAKPSDIVPCIAFSINRFSEAQENPQIIRYGLIISALLWSYYGAQHELWLFVMAEIAVLLFILMTVKKYRVKLK